MTIVTVQGFVLQLPEVNDAITKAAKQKAHVLSYCSSDRCESGRKTSASLHLSINKMRKTHVQKVRRYSADLSWPRRAGSGRRSAAKKVEIPCVATSAFAERRSRPFLRNANPPKADVTLSQSPDGTKVEELEMVLTAAMMVLDSVVHRQLRQYDRNLLSGRQTRGEERR